MSKPRRRIIAEIWVRQHLALERADAAPFSRHYDIQHARVMLKSLREQWPNAAPDYWVLLLLQDGAFIPTED